MYRSVLKFAAAGLSVACIGGLFGSVAAAAQLDQSNPGPNLGGTAITSEPVAQVVTVGIPGTLVSVDFGIRKFDGFTFGDITVQIREVLPSGEPSSVVLGSKTFANATIAAIPAEFTSFDLSSLGLDFSAGDQIAIVVFSPNHSGSSFPIALSENTYADGDLYAASSLSGPWFTFFSSCCGIRDTIFNTFVEDPVQVVGIDIKPGSDPNSINLCSGGVVPIGIFGSDTVDVFDINTESLRFADAAVKVVGKKDPHALCSYGDLNNDGVDDLVCQFLTQDIAGIDGESSSATLNGELFDGTAIEGLDSVNIVKDTCL